MSKPFGTIVSAEQVLERLDDPDLGLLEVNVSPEARNRESGALPGSKAVFWKDLAWDETRRLLASAEEFSQRLFALGFGEQTQIVLYGEPTQFASYVLWALRVRGYRNVSYLDGGLEAWKALGYPLAADRIVERRPATTPLPVPGATPEDEQSLIGRDGVLAALDDEDVLLLDFRSGEEYSGARVSGANAPIDHGAERHGRIPGARHFFFRTLLDDIGRFKPAEEIRREAEKRGIDAAHDIITYCRLSHRSTIGWLALTQILGLNNVRVYDGSWTEWGSIVGVPIEK
jgi:thiosulfate/3-mercaptopyruvate sulfurtransferase